VSGHIGLLLNVRGVVVASGNLNFVQVGWYSLELGSELYLESGQSADISGLELVKTLDLGSTVQNTKSLFRGQVIEAPRERER